MHVVKGDSNGAVAWNNRKKVGPCPCLDGHIKESLEMYGAGARP